jgi:pSer/pThr/pTyr-binding forkhead associated (FHA) protein
LKDTKSSNGTFVNKERLSRSGEESNPVEIKAGDELQFGVDVIENKKVTHSSIVGRVTFISLDDPSS